MTGPQTALFDPQEIVPWISAVTLWEPWGSAIAWGLKTIETRHWYTPHRGPIAIHAAKTMNADCKVAWWNEKAALPARPALGCVVAVANLVRCVRMTEANIADVSDAERKWGHYEPGRFMWVLEDVRRLREPVPARGGQGLWHWVPPANLEDMLEPNKGGKP